MITKLLEVLQQMADNLGMSLADLTKPSEIKLDSIIRNNAELVREKDAKIEE